MVYVKKAEKPVIKATANTVINIIQVQKYAISIKRNNTMKSNEINISLKSFSSKKGGPNLSSYDGISQRYAQ